MIAAGVVVLLVPAPLKQHASSISSADRPMRVDRPTRTGRRASGSAADDDDLAADAPRPEPDRRHGDGAASATRRRRATASRAGRCSAASPVCCASSVAGAILGPTFFANIFQATNTHPEPHVQPDGGLGADRAHHPAARRRARRARHRARAASCCASSSASCSPGFASPRSRVIAVLARCIVHLLTLGVHGPTASAARTRECWVLLFLVLPQIGFYGIIAVAIAAQNARGKFALAAAAPAIENIGHDHHAACSCGRSSAPTRATCRPATSCSSASARRWPSRCTRRCSASARRASACRCGRGWGWHDPAVRALAKRLVPAIGTATLDASWLFILIVAAGVVPGGVVALQIGINFYYLPVALSAKAVGTVLLPRLSREALHEPARRVPRDLRPRHLVGVVRRGARRAHVAACRRKPIARVDRVRRDARATTASRCLSASIASLGLALVGATMYEFAKQACYARHDVDPAARRLRGDGRRRADRLADLGAPAQRRRRCSSGSASRSRSASSPGRSSPTAPRARARTRQGASARRARSSRHVGVAVVTIVPGCDPRPRAIAGRDRRPHRRDRSASRSVSGGGLLGYVAVQALLGAPELPPQPAASARRGAERRRCAAKSGGRRRMNIRRLLHRWLLPIGRDGSAGRASFVFVAARPVWAAYVFLATQPFVGGIDRGTLIPLLRPSEAIQLFLTAAVLAGVVGARRPRRAVQRPLHEARPRDRVARVVLVVDLAAVLDVRARPHPDEHRLLRARS